ncbi:MAG: acetoacetate--CoA ligase [Alphaproteobacteria bacterium]|nr:acetoacetate--CoA ligase [Alphaproteobacteria bacterium]
MNHPLWTPSVQRIQEANIIKFMAFVEENYGRLFSDFSELHHWSTTEISHFWEAVSKFCTVKFSKNATTILSQAHSIEKAKFFEDATLNYAENLLGRRDETDAIIFWGENVIHRRLSFKSLYEQVSKVAQYFQKIGIKPGDRVAGFVPNAPEAIICMLATASLGAVWTSCSPDFGVSAVIDRFGQVGPSVLVASDRYVYKGKEHGCLCKVKEIQSLLPSLKSTIVFSYDGLYDHFEPIPDSISYQDILTAYEPQEIAFVPVQFNDPLFIMYSSGTTGVPKCIVHGVGGTLLQHLKEHQLHCNIKPNDRVFYFSTCGWMMWNWQVSALASGATVLIYDGSPVHPSDHILFDFIEQERITFFGIAAKVIDEWRKRGLCPKESHDLSSLKDMASTGSPLVAESFDYVYQNIKEDLGLMSISGGTDILSCFVLGNPIAPVWRGEIQTAGLGMAVEIFDDEGSPVLQEKGELVCTKPFPSMPIYFWKDEDRKKYHNAYFARYPNIWCHGDFAEKTEHDGFVIYGRSDTVLNPGGVRIGTAEIYRQVEKVDTILESIVVGQNTGDDVRIILFVKLREGSTLTEDLKNQIKTSIRQNATPRHVPAIILAVPDIPRTKSGKLVELAVKNIIEGCPVKNKDALANPEALKYFENLEALALT